MTEENFFDMFNRIHNPGHYYAKKKTKQKKIEKKSKKQKRKKRIESHKENPIPYSKYRIEWMDILSDSGWATDKEFHRMKLAFPVNEGWLFSRDKYTIKMFASYDRDADTNEITFGDRTMIPLACVKKMVKLS